VAPCRLRLADGRTLSAYVLDVSPRGARVACDQDVAAGSAMVMELRLGSRGGWSRLPGEVKWCKRRTTARARYVFGLTFAGVSADQQALLDGALEEFRRRADQLA
jgi:hypothetical protein